MSKILVIEDAPEVLNLISDSLRLNGYEIVTAEDGERGIELAKMHLPDLVLCDVRMPKKDGYSVLASLRDNPATATRPFIFLTGATDKFHVRQGMELGADDYITKPFTLGELLKAVRTRLEKQDLLRRQMERQMEELRVSIRLALPHELLTPLNGILGFSALLVDESERLTAGEVREFAQNIQRSAERLNRLVGNFLVYSQIELVAADPDKVRALRQEAGHGVRVAAVAERVAKEAAEAEKRPGEVNVAESGEAIWPMPEEKTAKVLQEVVGNAVKFSSPGSGIGVAVWRDEKVAAVEVRDRGRGMTSEQIAKIGPYMQFQRHVHEQQGAGLGLVIARRLIEVYGGCFRMESRPGEGTTVRMAFAVDGTDWSRVEER